MKRACLIWGSLCVNYRNPGPRRGEPRVGSGPDVAFPVDPVDPLQSSVRLIFIVKNSVWEPHGVLKRIKRKRDIRCGTDPGFPTPGARITVVYTNSLKWYHMMSYDIIWCHMILYDKIHFLDMFRTCPKKFWGSKMKFFQKVLGVFGLSFGIIGGV